MRIHKVLIVVGIVLFVVLGAVLPFVRQPKIKEETKNNLDLSDFYDEKSSGERAKVISQNGEALRERIRLISQAQEEIILSTFEFDSDRSGMMMIAALADAAQRGVKVSVLVDGFPYLKAMWGNPYFLSLAGMENVEIKVYSPVRPWKPWALMGRMHDKYLLVDDVGYILGGRNTFDFFLGEQPGYKNYDWDVFVYTKEADKEKSSLWQVKDYFQSVWEQPQCKTLGKSAFWKWNPAVKSAGMELKSHYQNMGKKHGEWMESIDYREITLPVNKISLISNPTHIMAKEPVVFYTMTELMKQAKEEWMESIDYREITLPVNKISLISNPTHIMAKEPVVFYTMTELMKQAKEEVVFHTPYIICDDWMLEQLKNVCSQVKQVTMMTNSVANNGNPFGAMDYQKYKGKILETGVKILEYDGGISYHGKQVTMMTNSVANNGNPFGAMDYQKYKGKILETGVKILEYDGGISYHGKCFAIDDRISGIGSFNWDMRSAYLDTEVMLVIDSIPLNEQLRKEMEQYEKDSLKVIDEDSYELKKGQKIQEIKRKYKFRIDALRMLAGWARFLM